MYDRGQMRNAVGGRMTQVMKGVRVLEVAQFTFVPAAGAILADWGADVIKIEHPVRGDTQRGFLNMGGVVLDPNRHTLIEHPNRGKRSVGIDISTAQGQELLYEIAKDLRRLPHELPAVGAAEEQVRRRAHPRGQSEHHLCARQRLWRQRPRARCRRIRRHRILVAQRHRAFDDARRARRAAHARHSGVRRFDRRHVHRRRHLRRPVPSRTHRRSRRARRLAAEHGLVGLRRPGRARHGEGRDHAQHDADLGRLREESA